MFGGFGHGLRFSSFIILYGWCIPEVIKLIIRAAFCKDPVQFFSIRFIPKTAFSVTEDTEGTEKPMSFRDDSQTLWVR
jgi:hypothetical protein